MRLHIAFGVVRAIRLASVPACTGEVSEVMTTPRTLADVLAEAAPPTREMTAPAAATAVRILTVLNLIGFVPLLTRSCRQSQWPIGFAGVHSRLVDGCIDGVPRHRVYH